MNKHSSHARSRLWKNDDELFAIVKQELYTAVVGDIMDKLGLMHQFLPPEIQPLHADMFVMGRAMPVLEADVFADRPDMGHNALLKQPFGLMLQAVDDLFNDDRVAPATWAALATRFDEKQRLDMLITAGGYRMVSMSLNTFGVAAEPDSEPLPEGK